MLSDFPIFVTIKLKATLPLPVFTLALSHWSDADILDIQEACFLFVGNVFSAWSIELKPAIYIVDILINLVQTISF